MKIALLSFEYPPETGFGGIGTYAWYQARAMAKLGHEVHVLAGATEPTDLRDSTHDGVRVFRFRTGGIWMKVLRRLEKHRLWWTKNRLENALSMHRGFRPLWREHQYDAVEMPECGAEGGLINHFTDAPTIIKFHSPARLIMPTYDVRKADHVFCSLVEEVGIRGAGALTSCSQFLADEVNQKMGVQRHIQKIANGIDLELFDSSEQVDARAKFNIPRGKPMIFFANRLESRKGIHFAKDVAANILEKHDVAFVFAGADLFEYMEKTLQPYVNSRQLKGSLHYVGKLDLTDVRSCLRQADIFFIPSVWENCPYSCLEAMAAGLPIVSSNAGGMPELIRHEENGLLANFDDVATYTAHMSRLIEDSSLRERLGNAARQSIEQSFTDVHIAEKTVQYYRQSLGQAS
jgi:glycosyltransferase involved in cell wall biosynthesis